MDFRGTYTAMVTPFRDGVLDSEGYRKLLKRQKDAGVTGVVTCGCTGEAATLDHDERARILDLALETVGDSMQVIAGTGTNSTRGTIEMTKEAEAAGAHAAMLITPYYNKPSQAGLLGHYRRVADETELPLVLYNVPGRTAVTLAPATIQALYATGRYQAVKEAGGSLDAVSNIVQACDITVLSGDDSLTVPMMALGAAGVVSVVSNLVPDLVCRMVASALEGDFARAREIHFRLLPVMRAAFVETNPSPMKAMLWIRGLIANEVRLPLAPVSGESLEAIRRAVESVGEAGGVRA